MNKLKQIYVNLNKTMNNTFDSITMKLFKRKYGDSVKHSILTILINTSFFLLYSLFFSLTNSVYCASITTIGIFWLREYFDKLYTTGFSKKDIFFDIIGLFISTIAIIIFI
jgi:hypothetical protein